jgi:hypothetical protein
MEFCIIQEVNVVFLSIIIQPALYTMWSQLSIMYLQWGVDEITI